MRVLFLVHDYPPVGGGGVQRVLHLVRLLAQSGHDVHVVAPEPVPGGLRDESLLARHPAQVPVTRYRLPSLQPVLERFRRLRLSRLPTLLLPVDLYPDATVFARVTARAAIEIGRRFRPDVVIASAPPHGICEAARVVAQELRAALVLDLRDPWVEPLVQRLPSRVAFGWSRMIQRRSLPAADLIVVTAPTLEKMLRALPGYALRRIVTITNGFDETPLTDPAADAKADAICVRPGVRTAAFVGRLFVSDANSGSHRGRWADRLFDSLAVGRHLIRGRDYHAGPWFRALDLLAARRPDLAGRLRTVFVGDVPPQGAAAAGTRQVFPVEFHGYQSIAVASAVMRRADALLLFNPSTTDDSPSFIIPGKMFEYLNAGPPILAMCGPGDCADIVRATGAGLWMHDRDPLTIGAVIEGWLDGRDLGIRRKPAEIARYSRMALGLRFVAEVEAAVEARSNQQGNGSVAHPASR